MINKLTEIKMRYLFLILLITVFSCKGVEKNNNQSKQKSKTVNIDKEGFQKNRRKKEIEYIKRRNRNVEYFKNKEINDAVDRQMNDSIKALEKLLKNILLPTKVNTINTAGKISVITFFPELGFGMLDGLMS
ncbi:hypothetical protein [uncultured Tenacibaculum sp.]|uniref:hypothetical protein n=2 Tax=Tenacibaculum TaxID=104267 RepID=UPI00262D2713|nr:hypothetical protein [uncultured Tenacibaculum sp.]